MAKKKTDGSATSTDNGATEESEVKPMTEAEKQKLVKDVLAKAKSFEECEKAAVHAKSQLDALVGQMHAAGLVRFQVGSKLYGIGARGEQKFLRVTDLSAVPKLG